MKKLIVSALAALSFGALSAADTDQYLWWMIDDKVKITNFDGTEGSLDGLTAKIAVDGGTTYLNLYDNSYDGVSFGKAVAATDVKDFDIFAGIGDYGYANSFIVELWNETTNTKEFTSEQMSYSALSAYIGSMKGMDTPSSVYSVKSFTAVPEPTSGLLLLLGVAGLALRRKNKKA